MGGIVILDIGVIVGMQFFLESISRKRKGSSIISKRNASALAAKAGSPVPGAPIPAPTATAWRDNSQRLSVLLQEDFLVAVLTEHWGKFALGLGLTVVCRLPQYLFNSKGVLAHMLHVMTVMLRCMSCVMLLIRDDVAAPKP